MFNFAKMAQKNQMLQKTIEVSGGCNKKPKVGLEKIAPIKDSSLKNMPNTFRVITRLGSVRLT